METKKLAIFAIILYHCEIISVDTHQHLQNELDEMRQQLAAVAFVKPVTGEHWEKLSEDPSLSTL